MFTVGERVELLRDVERYPHFIAPKGATGTVTGVDEELVRVRLDQPLPGAEEWGNEVQWHRDWNSGELTADVRRLPVRGADELRARMEEIRSLNPHGYEQLQSYRNAAAQLRRLEEEV